MRADEGRQLRIEFEGQPGRAGAESRELNRQSGLCPRCTELMHLNEEIAFNEILLAEREEAADEGAIAGIRRERDKMRQRNSRLCRRFGLKSRRARKGDR